MKTLTSFAAAALALMLAGCTAWFTPGLGSEMRSGTSSSLVDYLYPGGQTPPEHTGEIPYLELPLRVGLAFVPNRSGRSELSEATKAELLEIVRQAFIEHDYVTSIEVIPDTYLRSSTGVSGMQQVARLYGVDVMALVSYDQVSVASDTKASVLYWTIVGAYVIKGTENEVQTFVDTAVFDVKTAKLLFRAPGVHRDTDRSTAIESTDAARRQREGSFRTAMDTMTGNLGLELARFEERVAENPQLAQVEWKEGYGGMGKMDGLVILLLVLLVLYGLGDHGRRRS